ncbi:L-threonylcarbamoyladenylate synthase [Aquamicrobium zhengzhouense]|uniref:Threonylcarbamoyl-AMP synthase n=1 Tax=Aquamicrobium zhengzhouense TaxID=2781738 RepID=A0ABS0SF78_9HYPH|nr:L-threonylcarbamoyladenylate synthase [Aquamicrobium zhengzhouense]MBI1621959.1 threonylcarbamoyl-AMP synthase [Aquamicrobium zhengzhouense]
MAKILPPEQALEDALDILRSGEPVAIPTETVYGLAADATNGEAVARIFEVKGRPRFNPLIVHVADMEMAHRIAVFDEISLTLAQKFWPGPLTLVLPLREGHGVHGLVSAGLETVALRMPRGFASQLIQRLGRPLAAPSANSSGKISGTTAQAVNADLGGKIKLVVDGGPADVGVESTIAKVTPEGVRILRPGSVTAGDLEALTGLAVLRGGTKGIEAPGMMLSHYAPDARVRLDATELREGEALLAFGPSRIAGAGTALAMLNLSEHGSLREAAANLYSHLQALDRSGASVIAVEPLPQEGLGEAINDRLRRAAAPRGNESGSQQ